MYIERKLRPSGKKLFLIAHRNQRPGRSRAFTITMHPRVMERMLFAAEGVNGRMQLWSAKLRIREITLELGVQCVMQALE